MADGLQFDPEPAGADGGPAAELRAVPPRPAGAGAESPDQRVIVKVRRPDYVPDGFDVRSRVDDVLFTANASAEAVEAAGSDPEVESISVSRPLRPTD
ncbi:MAG: hypothetical protein ACR2MO_00805 [Acidimicrobiales bacterium]